MAFADITISFYFEISIAPPLVILRQNVNYYENEGKICL